VHFVAKLRGRKQVDVLRPRSQNRGEEEGGTDINPLCPRRIRGAHVPHHAQVGAVGMTDEAAAGYYLVKWLSKPYTPSVNPIFDLEKLI
jgi:hypothetical protein